MSDNILDQAEIDALLRMAEENSPAEEPPEADPPVLTKEEEDALGEVGNIAMGAAATTLSTLLNQKVSITSPRVEVKSRKDLLATFTIPYLVVNIRYTEGIEASTLLVIRVRDAAVIADLMMGNDGSNPAEELDELGVSAASEAMNQMIGASATSLASLVGRSITISPPTAEVMEQGDEADAALAEFEGMMVTISFKMQIGELVDTEIMQIMTVETAKEEAALLWEHLAGSGAVSEEAPAEETATEEAAAPEVWPEEKVTPAFRDEGGALQPDRSAEASAPVSRPAPPGTAAVDKEKLDLILDIPLKVTVILGRTRRPIQEVLDLAPGAIVELAALADEPVEILVNGVMVAKGEVVVVNENFGVRITSILGPRERMEQLYSGGGWL